MNSVTLVVGDSRERLAAVPDASANLVMTSPPYYEQRDYGVECQIGHEATPADFIGELMKVFAHLHRILTDDGTCWVNIGDCIYSGNGSPTVDDARSPNRNFSRRRKRFLDTAGAGIPKKSFVGIPWLFAFAMQKTGWILRSEIIWHRPGSFTDVGTGDRPRRTHETLFLFAKSRRYYFDKQFIDTGTVWTIPFERTRRGHSAAFPEALVERVIGAGCPGGGYGG